MTNSTKSKQNDGPTVDTRRMARGLTYIVLAAVAAYLLYILIAAPIRVSVYDVRLGPIVSETMGTGTLEARVKATISPKISGRLAQVFVDQGDRVKTGQVLVNLDNDELHQQVEIATSSIAVAKAALDRLSADKHRAIAVLAQANFEFNRTDKLYEKDTAASVELARANEALSIAQAELARAEAAIVEGQNELITQQKTHAYHQARLAETQIVAPFDGLIVRRHRDPGDVVVPGSPIISLISTEELWITAWVDETEMMSLRPSQVARVIFRSHPEHDYPGIVSRLGREADRQTREFVVDVRLLELPQNWAVGQRAEVFIETARKDDVLVLPASWLKQHDGNFGVYVEKQGRAVWRPLTIGLRNRDSVEVLSGLKPGETVVFPVNPKTQIRDGRKVEHVQ